MQHLLLLLALASLLTSIHAGCYKDKSTKPIIPESEKYMNFKPAPLYKEEELPENFNWCDLDGVSYCTPNWNQHLPQYCGSCWAHGTLSTLNDRIKIAKKAQGPDVMLSRQTLLNCGHFHGFGRGCDGGDTLDVFKFMYHIGLPHEDCMPYNATDHHKWDGLGLKDCPADAICRNCMIVNDTGSVCWNVNPVKYYLKSYGQCCKHSSHKKTVRAMMSEIYTNGPITCGMAASDNFCYNYTYGIWQDDGDRKFDHDVEVVGWGEENGQKYWLVRNSWGTYWGELGFFRIARGTNAQGLEEGDCWVGEPDISMELKYKNHELVGTLYGVIPVERQEGSLSSKGTSENQEMV